MRRQPCSTWSHRAAYVTGAVAVCLTAFMLPAWATGYAVRAAEPATLALAPPTPPDLSGYTHAAVLAKRVRRAHGTVRLERMVHLTGFDEFVGGDERLALWASRQARNPVAIVLSDGLLTPQMLAAQLPPRFFEQTAPGIFVARLPILVAANATLHVDRHTRALRLSQQGGAFLVNEGRLFVTDSAVVAWDEHAGAPAAFVDKQTFRPFIVSWGGSQTYFSRSTFRNLGYGDTKSYGVTLSQYSGSVAETLKRPRPTGWIVDSVFSGLLYGFYCYEADDVVIIGSTYADNIVYGIDPHDRSERLIIANNTAYGTRKRHGIIISREVNHTWIVGNESYDNKLAGIMLDRQSQHNVVANNVVHGNGADGITVYESPNNLLYNNESIGNGAHGYRVRNSVAVKLYENRAINNAYTGITGHARRLDPGSRDLELDPYDTRISLVVVGGALMHNGGGPIAIDQPISVELFDVKLIAPANSTGIEMSGVLGEHLPRVLDLMIRQRKAVVIEPDNLRRTVEG